MILFRLRCQCFADPGGKIPGIDSNINARFTDDKDQGMAIGRPGSGYPHPGITAFQEATVLLFGLAQKLAKLSSGILNALL
ncbi:hypothetical protein MASR1M36_08850 [Candidatus Cloacimonadaceae bacterium]